MCKVNNPIEVTNQSSSSQYHASTIRSHVGRLRRSYTLLIFVFDNMRKEQCFIVSQTVYTNPFKYSYCSNTLLMFNSLTGDYNKHNEALT